MGYAKIGNMGHNLYRMMTWHLRGVEGYGRRVERGMEGEFHKGGEGRLRRMAKGDVMMKGRGGWGSPFVPVAFKTLGQFNILLYSPPPSSLSIVFSKKIIPGGNNQRSNLDSRGDGSLV